MAEFLKNTIADAETFLARQEDAWAQLKRDHDQAMFVFEVEDLVDYGISLLRCWARHAESWHRWVSEDPARYDAKRHEKLRRLERMASQAAQGTIELINEVKTSGHEIQRESEFCQVAEHVISSAASPAQQFIGKKFAEYQKDAWQEYQAGEAKEITNWGD